MSELKLLIDKVEEVRLSVARMEVRLDALEDHEARLKDLELWRARMIGLSLGVGVMSSLVTSLLLWVLTATFGVAP